MKRMLSVLLLMIFIMGCSHVAPPREIIRRGSGPYPEHYVEIITHYLNSQMNVSGDERFFQNLIFYLRGLLTGYKMKLCLCKITV